MNESTNLVINSVFNTDFISEVIRKIDESPVPVEISINYYPDGEVDMTISPYRPITYNCPFANRINNTEDDNK